MSVKQLFAEMRESFEQKRWEDFDVQDWFSEYSSLESAMEDICREECSFKFKGKDVKFVGIFGGEYNDGCLSQEYVFEYGDELFCIYGYYESWEGGEIDPTPYMVEPYIFQETRYKKGEKI